jgi:hypothetical protein
MAVCARWKRRVAHHRPQCRWRRRTLRSGVLVLALREEEKEGRAGGLMANLLDDSMHCREGGWRMNLEGELSLVEVERVSGPALTS